MIFRRCRFGLESYKPKASKARRSCFNCKVHKKTQLFSWSSCWRAGGIQLLAKIDQHLLVVDLPLWTISIGMRTFPNSCGKNRNKRCSKAPTRSSTSQFWRIWGIQLDSGVQSTPFTRPFLNDVLASGDSRSPPGERFPDDGSRDDWLKPFRSRKNEFVLMGKTMENHHWRIRNLRNDLRLFFIEVVHAAFWTCSSQSKHPCGIPWNGELLCGAEEGRGALPVFSLLLPAAKLFSPDSRSRSLLPF